jgi:hypothetical protein
MKSKLREKTMRWIQSVTLAAMALTVTTAATMLAGCATSSAPNSVDWPNGARRGWVVSTYTPGQDASTLPACLASLPAADYAARRFVKIRYRQARLLRTEVAEITPGLQLRDGDRVELWPADCAAGKLSRISKVFSAADAAANHSNE